MCNIFWLIRKTKNTSIYTIHIALNFVLLVWILLSLERVSGILDHLVFKTLPNIELMVIFIISGYHETALKNKEATECPEELLERTETFSAALLTSHLLTKLMPGDNYVISSDFSDKPLLCPCHDNCGMLMKYGSTGLGLSYIQSFLWKVSKGWQ